MLSIIENTFFDNCRYWGSLCSRPHNSGSIWAMKTGIESSDLNMVWNEKPLLLRDIVVVQSIKRIFFEAGLPFWWWVFPVATSQMTTNILTSAGFSLVERIPSMLADLAGLSDLAPCDSIVSIRQVQTREDLDLWEETSFAGFDFHPENRAQYQNFVGAFHLGENAPQKLFLAFVNKIPVATSLLFLNGEAAGIYFVCTLPHYRKQGIGLLITKATMHFARISGSRFATLQSSPDGLNIYSQAGFKESCKVDVYSLNGVCQVQ